LAVHGVAIGKIDRVSISSKTLFPVFNRSLRDENQPCPEVSLRFVNSLTIRVNERALLQSLSDHSHDNS
jgi:hypothetical protein